MTAASSKIEQRVEAVLAQIRPYLDSDGLHCELAHVEDNIVYVRITTDSPMSATLLMTIKMGIERKIVEAIPQIDFVEPL